MPQRLTNDHRRVICSRAIDHAIGKDQKQLDAAWECFGEDVYRDIYSENDRRRMTRLPDGWLPERTDLMVQFGVDVTKAHFSKRRIIADHDNESFYRKIIKQFSATHELSERREELQKRKTLIAERKDEITRKVMATLHSVQTVKRLLEVWPESKLFLDGLTFEIANLPTVTVKQLNKLLGIAA